MKTLMKLSLLIVLFLFLVPLSVSATIQEDTKLLSQPAISENHIAFIYAEDLWIANRDGSNPR